MATDSRSGELLHVLPHLSRTIPGPPPLGCCHGDSQTCRPTRGTCMEFCLLPGSVGVALRISHTPLTISTFYYINTFIYNIIFQTNFPLTPILTKLTLTLFQLDFKFNSIPTVNRSFRFSTGAPAVSLVFSYPVVVVVPVATSLALWIYKLLSGHAQTTPTTTKTD